MLNVFTFFYNRFNDATTSLALRANGIEHKVLIHKEEDYIKFKKGGTIGGEPIITNKPKGLAYQRNAALELMKEDEWAVFMCDDFQYIRSYPVKEILNKNTKIDVNFDNQKKYSLRQDKFKMSLKQMFTMFPKLIEIAEIN
jgi:glycosyltransferase involved in cell wall biosynthesis